MEKNLETGSRLPDAGPFSSTSYIVAGFSNMQANALPKGVSMSPVSLSFECMSSRQSSRIFFTSSVSECRCTGSGIPKIGGGVVIVNSGTCWGGSLIVQGVDM
ncbi:hypothetical protein N7513_007233 [Penicillium frequentans]|nr:hypothetical protein N7513_007233 [Penicillium glabrum]